MDSMQRPARPRIVSYRRSLLAALMLGMLAVAPAPHAAQTAFSIRITPHAAALIAALHRGVAPAIALAHLPQPGSAADFARSCNAANGAALITTTPNQAQRICL